MIHKRQCSGQRDNYIRQYEILKKGTWNIFLFSVGYISRNRHGESDISVKLSSILYSCRWHYMFMDNCLVAFIKQDQWATHLWDYGFLWWPFIWWTLWWPSRVFAFEAIILSSFSFWMLSFWSFLLKDEFQPQPLLLLLKLNHSEKNKIAFIGVEGSN